MRKLTNIQFLRAFAALNVVLFHILSTAHTYGYKPISLEFLAGWGACGVDLFFVISGFIMVYIQSVKERSPTEFIVERILRVCPTYWLLTGLIVLITIYFPSVLRTISYSKDWAIYSFAFLSDTALHKQPMLYLGWTLELEMFFYLLFSVSLISKSLNKSILIVSALLILTIIFTSISDKFMLIEFIFGMMIAWEYVNKEVQINIAKSLFLLGFCLMLLSVWIHLENIHRVIRWGIPAALIVYGSVYLKQVNNKLFLSLGNASYSIYLIQIFCIPVYFKLISHYKVSANYSSLCALVGVVFSGLVGYLFYTLVERKLSDSLLFVKAKFNIK